MRRAFPEAVETYEHLIDSMTNHPKDRHVLAPAVAAEADVIVTLNTVLSAQAARTTRPPMSLADKLNRLAPHVPAFVGAIRAVAPADDASPPA